MALRPFLHTHVLNNIDPTSDWSASIDKNWFFPQVSISVIVDSQSLKSTQNKRVKKIILIASYDVNWFLHTIRNKIKTFSIIFLQCFFILCIDIKFNYTPIDSININKSFNRLFKFELNSDIFKVWSSYFLRFFFLLFHFPCSCLFIGIAYIVEILRTVNYDWHVNLYRKFFIFGIWPFNFN